MIISVLKFTIGFSVTSLGQIIRHEADVDEDSSAVRILLSTVLPPRLLADPGTRLLSMILSY